MTELEVFSLTVHKVTKIYTTNQKISNPVFDGIKLPEAIKDTSYDPFLSSMVHIKLHKSQNAFDTASYLRLAYNVNITLKPKTVKHQAIDPKAIQPCIAFLPCTTQLAKWHTRVPLQRHWKPQFPI